jgi:Rieske 2Fe-2S family protein
MPIARPSRSDSAPDAVDGLIAAQAPGRGLARDFYLDPGVFARDMERIFRRHWHCAGHASAIPRAGDFVTLAIERESIVLVRDERGAIHAFLNVCRHRGAEVCTAPSGNAAVFVCPYHAWSYGLDGSLKAARHMPRDFDLASHGLRKLQLRLAEGLIFIAFAERPLDFTPVAETLRTTCGRYGWGEARIAHRATFEIAANWKLAVENYVECYHCSPAHPEYARTHALEQPAHRIEGLNARLEARTRALGVEIVTGDHWRSSAAGREAIHSFRYALYDGVATGSEDGKPLAPPMGGFRDFDGGLTSIHVGGASFLVCYPDHGVIYRFVPRALEGCAVELIWLVRGDAAEGRDYDLARLTWLWTVTTAQDKKIIEHAARGVRSHYFVPGPIAPMEYNQRRWLDWYLEEIARA